MRKFYQLHNASFKEKGVKTYEELWKVIRKDYKGLSICVNTEFKEKAEQDNRFHVVMSTATEDRHGDIVNQNWDLKAFKKNPVFLDSHNYDSIEHIIGKVHNPKVKDGALQGDIEFMLDNPKGMLAYKMAKGGFLNASSVGFIPKEFDEKGNILKSELLEDSAVSVPANAEALFEKSIKEIGEEIENGSTEPDNTSPTPSDDTEEEVEEEETDTLESGGEELEEGQIEDNGIVYAKPKKLDALRRYVEKREQRRQEILKETLAVIQRLQKEKVDSEKRKQMVNRTIRQLLKVK